MHSKWRWCVVGVWHWLLQGPKDNQHVLPKKHIILSASSLMMVTSHFKIILGPKLTWKLPQSSLVPCRASLCLVLQVEMREGSLIGIDPPHVPFQGVPETAKCWTNANRFKAMMQIEKGEHSDLCRAAAAHETVPTSVAEASYKHVETTKHENNTWCKSRTCSLEV